MTQADLLALLLKIGCITGFLSLTGWVVIYTRYAKWWQDQIGRTLVIKTLLIAGLLISTTLSLFFPLNRLIVSWIDAAGIAAITPVMIWRILVWRKVHKAGGRGAPPS